jgi:hypothetical protein
MQNTKIIDRELRPKLINQFGNSSGSGAENNDVININQEINSNLQTPKNK